MFFSNNALHLLLWHNYCQWCWHFVVVQTYPSLLQKIDPCITMLAIRGNLRTIEYWQTALGSQTPVVSSENSWQNICQAFLPWQKYCQWCWHFVVVETYPSSGNDNCGKWLQVILGNTMPGIRGNLSAIEAPRLKCLNARQNHSRPLLSPPITNGLVSPLRNCLASVYYSNVASVY